MATVRCECPTEGVATDRSKYDEDEWPGMKHAPGKCSCTAGVAEYRRGGQVLRLCSACNCLGDVRVSENKEKVNA